MDIGLDALNPQQRAAVTAPMQPVLVLAGAGSGKTRVLAYRVVYLIRQGLIDASNILALTFTNKAATEMKERVASLLQIDDTSPGLAVPHLSTFHSLGVKMLRQHGYLLGLSRSFSILDTDDQLRILKEVFVDEHIEESIKPQSVLHFVHAVKNTGKDPEEVAQRYRGYISQQFLAAYRGYQRALTQQGSVDLDDLICLPERLLREMPEVRAYYQHKFRYVLVDEYQDTNPIQYQLLRQLALPAGLFVVGDDAQSIYGFRGSDISNILNFERDFPNATVVVLDQNYRSTQNILAVAEAVLKHSTEQKPKILWTENVVGQKVVVEELSSEAEEADFIVRTLIQDASGDGMGPDAQLDEGLVYEEETPAPVFSVLDYMLQKKRMVRSPSHFVRRMRLPDTHLPLARYAILYRTHAQSRAIEAALMEAGVPYRIVGGLRFYERREVKDLLSYVRVLYNLKDTIALRRAFGTPARGIGEKTATVVKELVLAEQVLGENFGPRENMELIARVKDNLAMHVTPRARNAVTVFLDALLSWLATPEETPLHELLQRVVTESGLIRHYRDGTEAGDVRVENVQEFVAGARKFESMPWQAAMQDFLEEVALMNDGDNQVGSDDVVTLMTLHAVKGLEFDVVFFAGLEEGLLPHSRSMLDPSAFAEEVRLAYVGVTRARQKLYITYTRQRGLFGESRLAVPSRLLRGLPSAAVNFKGRQKFLPDVGVGQPHDPQYEPFYDE